MNKSVVRTTKDLEIFDQWFSNECKYIGKVGEISLYVIQNKIETYSYNQLFEYYNQTYNQTYNQNK